MELLLTVQSQAADSFEFLVHAIPEVDASHILDQNIQPAFGKRDGKRMVPVIAVEHGDGFSVYHGKRAVLEPLQTHIAGNFQMVAVQNESVVLSVIFHRFGMNCFSCLGNQVQ